MSEGKAYINISSVLGVWSMALMKSYEFVISILCMCVIYCLQRCG